MRNFLVIAGSCVISALIVGSLAGLVSTLIFYDFLFKPGHTDHERGIAWFFVGASALSGAVIVFVIGAVYWVITLCYRGLKARSDRAADAA